MREVYFDAIKRIAQGHADEGMHKETGAEPALRRAYMLNFADDSHYECLMHQYGGREHLEKNYPMLYRLMENTRRVHREQPPKRMLEREPGLQDLIYIYELGQSKEELFGSGAATLERTAERLYITMGLYDGDTRIASDSAFFHNVNREKLEIVRDPAAFAGKDLTAVLHVTWQDTEDTLCSAALQFTQSIAVKSLISNVDVSHPRTNPGPLPEPIQENAQAFEAQNVLRGWFGGEVNAEEVVNVCYARSPEWGERVDYVYPYGLTDGKQTIYLDIRGEIFLDGAVYQKMVQTDISMDTPYGGAIYNAAISEKNFEKTEQGVRFAFPTCWKTEIPGGKLAGRELCDLDVWITFQCEDADDYTVNITSQAKARQEIEYIKKVSRIKLNWGCLAADTRVRMADGLERRICEIHAGDWVMDENWNPVLVRDVMRGKENMLWTVQSEDGSKIRTTGTHPFLTRDGVKTAEQLMETDEVLREDGEYHRMKFRFQTYYGDIVYNLVLENNHNMIADGYVVGDQEMQHEAMHHAYELDNRKPDPAVQEECERLKAEFSKAVKE